MSQLVYYVEGDDEETSLKALKTELRLIRPGVVKILNIVNHRISNYHRTQFNRDMTAVFVFDTDVEEFNTLDENIKILDKAKRAKQLKDYFFIFQIPDLEHELLRSCDICKIRELLNSKSDSDFKKDLAKAKGLHNALVRHGFDFDKFWSSSPRNGFARYRNSVHKEKIKAPKR